MSGPKVQATIDSALVSSMVTSPWWVTFTQQWLSLVLVSLGILLAFFRGFLMYLEYRDRKRKQ